MKKAWIISLSAILIVLTIFTGCGNSTKEKSETGIRSLDWLFNKDVELDISNDYSSIENSYFTVKGNRDFNIDDIEFISNNPEVATIEYDDTALTTYVYYNITGISPGETTVYVQTKDGIIKSEEIKVIVVGETTTEPTTEEQTSIQKETTIQKETSTQKVTTTKSQSNKSEVNSSYVLNTDSMKFHKPSCHVAKKIDTENFSQSNKSYEELINDGYSPCGICLK